MGLYFSVLNPFELESVFILWHANLVYDILKVHGFRKKFK